MMTIQMNSHRLTYLLCRQRIYYKSSVTLDIFHVVREKKLEVWGDDKVTLAEIVEEHHPVLLVYPSDLLVAPYLPIGELVWVAITHGGLQKESQQLQ